MISRKRQTLNSNLILLIRRHSDGQSGYHDTFKFQSDSINTAAKTIRQALAFSFKFQSDSINTAVNWHDGNNMSIFKFQSDSINT